MIESMIESMIARLALARAREEALARASWAFEEATEASQSPAEDLRLARIMCAAEHAAQVVSRLQERLAAARALQAVMESQVEERVAARRRLAKIRAEERQAMQILSSGNMPEILRFLMNQ